MTALAYQRLGLARMLGTQDPRAQHDLRKALSLYEELLAASPGNPEFRFAIGDVAMNLGLASLSSRGMLEAEPFFRRATSIDEGLASDFPDDPEYLVQLTDRRLQIAGWMDASGLRTQAERELRQLVAFYDRLANASASPARAHAMADSYYRLARVLGDARPTEQQEAFRQGLRLKPESPALLNGLAWSLSLSPAAPPRDSAEAVERAKRALAVDPKERAFWNTLGLAHLRAGNWPQAEEALRKSIELQSHGGDASDRLVMAMLSWRRGDKAKALEWYIRSLDWMARYPDPDPSLSALRDETARLLGRSPSSDAQPER